MNYKECTVEELADYVQISTTQRITQQLMYYRNRGVTEMVEKIKAARKIVQKRKLLKRLEALG